MLKNPANPSSKKERLYNPKRQGLIVFPAKLVLLPGQTQFVRVVTTLKNHVRDRVYEVDFIPKIRTHLVQKTIPNGPTMGIRVVVGYGVRITSRPSILSPAASVRRIKDQLVIKNTGNTQLKIVSCTQLLQGVKTEIPLSAYTLFSGATITKKLDRLTPVTLELLVMDRNFGTFRTS